MKRTKRGRPVLYLAPLPPPPGIGEPDPYALPKGWPQFGTFQGEKVPLRGIKERVGQDVLDDLRVAIGGEETRPFRGREVEVIVSADGKHGSVGD